MYYSASEEHQKETLMKGFSRGDGKIWYEDNYSTFFCGNGKIYTLADNSGDVFYVGCTTSDIDVRISAHISEARNKSRDEKVGPKNKRIIELNYELSVTIVAMKYITGYDAISAMKKLSELEQAWIMKYIDLGYSLCNREAQVKAKKIKNKIPEFVGQTLTTCIVHERSEKSSHDFQIKVTESKEQ